MTSHANSAISQKKKGFIYPKLFTQKVFENSVKSRQIFVMEIKVLSEITFLTEFYRQMNGKRSKTLCEKDGI